MNSSRVRFHVSTRAMAKGHLFFSLKAFCVTNFFFFGGEGLYLEGLYMAGLIFGILPIEMHERDSQFMILALFSAN